MLGMVAVTSSAKYCFCHVGGGLFPLVLEANGAYSLHRDYKSMFLRESVAGGLERGGEEEKGWGGDVAQGQLKYRCLPVGVIPLSHDLHLEQPPENRHSSLSQEIEADSDLMRKVNLPNFYESPL